MARAESFTLEGACPSAQLIDESALALLDAVRLQLHQAINFSFKRAYIRPMDDQKRLIDLAPKDWQSDRSKREEPIFGDGLWPAVGYAISLILTFTVVYLIQH